MDKLLRYGWLPTFLLASAVTAGCNSKNGQTAPPQPPPPEVEVSLPVTRQVADYEDFPGRLEAVNSIDLRARVTGYLDKVLFKEGADIKEGDVLVEIDPRPTQAELNRAEANFVQAQAHVKRLDSDYERARTLLPKGSISQEEFDKIAGDRAEASAAVGVAKANRELAQLNLSYTKVKAPINGRITRQAIDPGNLVKADDTVLATIVSLDPIYAYFDLDERTTLRLQQLIREGKVAWSLDKGLPVKLGLANETGFPRQGTINYADPRVDPETGTWRLRGVFENAKRVLSPGLYVRVRLPIGDRYRATLVAEQSLGTDQGQKFVYVVDDAGKVAYRRVKVGRLQEGLRVITEGLKPDEKVVVNGLQRIRPGAEVKPQVVEMPEAQEGSGTKDQGSAKKPTAAP